MANSKVCFIKSNVKGWQPSKKQSMVIENLKNKLESNGELFLQKTLSVSDYKNASADDFKGQALFSHGTFNPRGVLIAYLDSKRWLYFNT